MERKVGWTARIAVAGIVVALPLVFNRSQADKSRYYFALDYGENLLKTLEPNALLLPAADHATFPGLYLQAVDGKRKDVRIGNKYGYIDKDLYSDMPEEIRNSFHKVTTNAEQKLIEEWIVLHTDRPVYLTEKRAFPDGMSVKMENAGLAYRVVKKGQEWQAKEYWSEYAWHTLDPKEATEDFTAGLVLADYYFGRGRDALAAGDKAKAAEYFETSARASQNAPENLNNMGTALAERNDLEGAAGYYVRSITADPDYVTGLRNLGQVYMALQKYDDAEPVLEHLRRVDAKDPNATLSHVACLRQLRRFEEARKELIALSKARPDDAKVYRELGMLYQNDLGDLMNGRKHIMRSLSLDPNQQDLAMMLSPASEAFPGLPRAPKIPSPASILPGLNTQY